MEKDNKEAKLKMPRGLRNNNPLNIRISAKQRQGKDPWFGMSAKQEDSAFCQFKEMKYGWRAAFMLLTRSYYHLHHLYTPRAVISRWAPPSENNTEAYIKFVCEKSGLEPDTYLGVPSSAEGGQWMKLAYAMAMMENGTENINVFDMIEGWILTQEYARKNGVSTKDR